MKEKYSTAIIGNKETILGFKALGLQTFNAKNSEEALEVLTDLKSRTIAIGNDEKRPELFFFICINIFSKKLKLFIIEYKYL